MNKKTTTKQLNNLTTNNLSDDIVVSVKNISKKFCKNLRRSMAHGITDLSKNLLGIRPNSTDLRRDEFWALNDVSFELRRGETLGLIGVNGSGKTTLLRLLAGIFPPDRGEVIIKGRVGPLIAVGAGFHPHMTGRENIYLNGAILGMSRKEIDSKFDDIVDFAEIGEFLEAPVSTYSSGMRVRLGFSIAIAVKPDVLLIDEILAVGDIAFQSKCFAKLAEVKHDGVGIILVSHNLPKVVQFCSNGFLIDLGRHIFSGPIDETVTIYEEYYNKSIYPEKSDASMDDIIRETPYGPMIFMKNYIRDIQVDLNEISGEDPVTINAGNPTALNFVISLVDMVPDVYLGLAIYTRSGKRITGFNSKFDRCPAITSRHRITGHLEIQCIALQPDDYVFVFEVSCGMGRIYRGIVKYVKVFSNTMLNDNSHVYLPRKWTIE